MQFKNTILLYGLMINVNKQIQKFQVQYKNINDQINLYKEQIKRVFIEKNYHSQYGEGGNETVVKEKKQEVLNSYKVII